MSEKVKRPQNKKTQKKKTKKEQHQQELIRQAKKKKRIKQKCKDYLFILLIIIGIGLVAYPFFTDFQLNKYQQVEIRNYNAANSKLSAKEKENYKEKLEHKQEKKNHNNRSLLSSKLDLKEKKLPEVISILEIPKIDLKVPVYPISSNLVLEKGIGTLEGTSLPFGGKGNHSVLTGHRGLSLGKMFTDLPKLNKGDLFYMDVLGETHAYEIDQIKTILPDDLSHFDKEEDKDLITLVTCTPIGINSHRLLVRGHRVPLEMEEKENQTPYFWNLKHTILISLLVVICLILIIRYLIIRIKQ